MKYNLDILPWQQFEVLAFKCLQIDVSPSMHYIEGGHDKGRDFTFKGVTNFFGTSNSSKKYLFQAKHKSGPNKFQSLKYDLSVELEKVYVTNHLDYDFYCLTTNITLSGDQLDELEKIFLNFFQSAQLDIKVAFGVYSYRHFESIIDANSTIKWTFPSIVSHTDFHLLLDELINRNERNIVAGWKSIFETNAQKFVYTTVYEEALLKVDQQNILLLSGPPKSGKTFTAEMIMFNYFCLQEFIPYKIERPEDFDRFFDANRKQSFLFDDAFGKHNLEFYRADAFDRKLEFIIELVDDNHKCLFTSREYILRAFNEYTDKEINTFVAKISVEAANLKLGEKESLFRRYFTLKFPDGIPPSDSVLGQIVEHKNFTPETIRAYFDESANFELIQFMEHLQLPDKYLEKVFSNLSKEKRAVLLSILFSLRNSPETIAYAFANVCEDLNTTFLISLQKELNLLEGSIIKEENKKYSFYHPSMFDFFIGYLGNDISIYRSLLLKNLNIELMTLTTFDESAPRKGKIKVGRKDADTFTLGFKRLIRNPDVALFEINSVLAWLNVADVQLHFKMKLNQQFRVFKQAIHNEINQLDWTKFSGDDAYSLSYFLHALEFYKDSMPKDKSVLIKILTSRKVDPNYWLIVFRAMPFLTEADVFDEQIIGRSWLRSFYSGLKKEIMTLGDELYGPAFPDFVEVSKYRDAMQQKKYDEASKMKFKQRSDHKKDTNRYWYPRFKTCKEKMQTLKSSHPYGFKLHQELLPYFDHLVSLEPNQKNRYIFLKQKKWW